MSRASDAGRPLRRSARFHSLTSSWMLSRSRPGFRSWPTAAASALAAMAGAGAELDEIRRGYVRRAGDDTEPVVHGPLEITGREGAFGHVLLADGRGDVRQHHLRVRSPRECVDRGGLGLGPGEVSRLPAAAIGRNPSTSGGSTGPRRSRRRDPGRSGRGSCGRDRCPGGLAGHPRAPAARRVPARCSISVLARFSSSIRASRWSSPSRALARLR